MCKILLSKPCCSQKVKYIKYWSNTYTYIHIHTYTNTHIYVHTNIYIYIYMYVYMYIYIHTYTYIHICIHPSIHPSIHTYIHTYICICICILKQFRSYISTLCKSSMNCYLYIVLLIFIAVLLVQSNKNTLTRTVRIKFWMQ